MSPPRRDLLAPGGLAAMPAGRPCAQGRSGQDTIITTAAENAFRPLQEGRCPLVRG